jgi:hypothetical protein
MNTVETPISETQDIAPMGTPMTPEVIVDLSQVKKARERNYSFVHKKAETLDEVEIKGNKYSIPAHIGSTYWAILKICYESANKPVLTDDLVKGVDELMRDRDEDSWNEFCGKEKVTVYSKLESKLGTKPIKPWQERVINNAKTLTRLGGKSPYGHRLFERGHVLRFGYVDKKPCFTLHTTLVCLAEEQKKKAERKLLKDQRAAKRAKKTEKK